MGSRDEFTRDSTHESISGPINDAPHGAGAWFPVAIGTAFVICLLVALVMRMPSFFVPGDADPDDGLNLVMAREIVQGVLPYTRHFEHRQPLLYVHFVPALLCSNLLDVSAALCARIFTVIPVAATSLALMSIVWQLTRSRIGAIAAAMAYPASTLGTGGLVAASEFFFAPWSYWCLAAVIRTTATSRRLFPRFVLIGVIGGVATATKLHAVFDVAVAGTVLLARLPASRWPAALVGCVLGGCSVWLAIAGVYALQGQADALIFSNFIFNRRYASRQTYNLLGNVDLLLRLLRSLIAPIGIIAYAGLIHLLGRSWPVYRTAIAISALGIAAAVLAVVINSFIWGHYVLQIGPALSLLAGVLIASAGTVPVYQWIGTRLTPLAVGAVLLATLVLRVPSVLTARKLGGPVNEVAAYVAEAPGSSLFVFDLSQIYYVASHRAVPTRFGFQYWYGDPKFRGILELDVDTFLDDLVSKQRPMFIVASAEPSPSADPAAQAAMTRILQQHYRADRRFKDVQVYRRVGD